MIMIMIMIIMITIKNNNNKIIIDKIVIKKYALEVICVQSLKKS